MPDSPFTSSLAFLVSSAETRARLERALEALSRAEPIAGTTGALEFAAVFVATEAELLQKLKDLPSGSQRSCAIVVSDQLTLPDSPAGHAPSALAKSIRAMFRENQNLCGIVALVSGEEHRTPDVDSVVSARDLDVVRLRRAITNAAMGLWMKSPPGFRPSDRSAAD